MKKIIFSLIIISFLLALSLKLESQTCNVNFSVDMNQIYGYDTVAIIGSWDEWDSLIYLTNTGSNIWQTTITLDQETTYSYKFKSSDKPASTYCENLIGECADPSGNRILPITDEDSITIDTVCYNSCDKCIYNEDEEEENEITPLNIISEKSDLYPNPSDTHIYVKSIKGEAIFIYDISGKQMKHIVSQNTTEYIDVTKLHDGIYFLHKENKHYKFVIAR